MTSLLTTVAWRMSRQGQRWRQEASLLKSDKFEWSRVEIKAVGDYIRFYHERKKSTKRLVGITACSQGPLSTSRK